MSNNVGMDHLMWDYFVGKKCIHFYKKLFKGIEWHGAGGYFNFKVYLIFFLKLNNEIRFTFPSNMIGSPVLNSTS